MCGCPNGCSQHHIANIGFYGASIKVGDHTIPAYIAHVGGNYEGGEVVFGHRLKARLPAKRVPDAVERWIRHYEEKRNDGEDFNDFVERVGTEPFEELISDLSLPVEFNAENLTALHRLEPHRALQGRARRGRVRGLMEPTATTQTDTRAPQRQRAPRRSCTSDGANAAHGRASRSRRSIAADLEDATAEEALRWALDTFHPGLYIACSFQKTSSVTVHMATQIDPDARFFYLDTDVLFQETYETRDALEERYGIKFHRYSSITLEQQAGLYGDELWNRDPDACCGIRKVEPMRSALSAVDCWVSGIRRQDSQARAKAPKFAWDKRFGLWKLNPLADWTREARLGLHPRARHPLQPAARPGLSLDRLHPLHQEAGARARTRAPGAGPAPSKTECGLHG